MKKFLLMLCCAAVCAGFVGCSDDEDDGVSAKSLVGRWSCYLDEYLYEDGSEDVEDEYGDGVYLYIMQFNADGTCGEAHPHHLSEELDDEKYDWIWRKFTYSLKGERVIIRLNGSKVREFRVVKITSSELVVVYQGVEDGMKFTETRYFHRLK